MDARDRKKREAEERKRQNEKVLNMYHPGRKQHVSETVPEKKGVVLQFTRLPEETSTTGDVDIAQESKSTDSE